MAEKEDKVQLIKLKSSFWAGFFWGLGFTLGVLVILFFVIGILVLIINNISPGLLF